jgi:hypothetical protein
MRSVEKRIAALEGPNGGSSLSHLSDTELKAVIERKFIELGTTYDAEVEKYGSEEAFLQAVMNDLSQEQSVGGLNAQR